MVKIALDPTPFHSTHSLLEFPALAADLGYKYLQMTPHPDMIPFFNHPKADDDLVKKMKKAVKDAGIEIASTLPVLRWSGPDEDAREAAVRYWKRVIRITAELGVDTIGTEFNGRPERAEESERAFYRSMEELVPIIEKEGIKVFIDPHPDDFVENGLAAWRVIRGINSDNFGMVYVASHTFHMGNQPAQILEAAKGRVGIVHMSDTMDHTASHGLRYITNPPGNSVRVHQHLRIGAGDVNFDEMFKGLKANGFLDNKDSIMCSSVFAENENAREMSIYQRETIEKLIAKHQ
ncbi:MAG: sugar phosphate isomerase/epimerase family protein [Rhodoluna sp.]